MRVLWVGLHIAVWVTLDAQTICVSAVQVTWLMNTSVKWVRVHLTNHNLTLLVLIMLKLSHNVPFNQKCNTFFFLKISTLDLCCCYKLCENSFIDVCGNIFGKLQSMRRRQPTLRKTVLPTLPVRTAYVNAHQAIQRPLTRCVSRVDIYVVYTHSDIVFEPYFHTQYFTC